MKRLTFKTEFVPLILDGTKTGTGRWKDPKLKVGDIVSAVTRQGSKPAFLVPAAEGFVKLRITNAEAMFWKDFGPQQLKATTVQRDWYLQECPTASDFSEIFYIEWELVREDNGCPGGKHN